MPRFGFNGSLMGTRRVPTTSSASGVWNWDEQSVARRAAIWPGTDLYLDYVTLMIQPSAEADNSTVFTDLSNYNRTLTTNGDAKIRTNITRFGKPTISFDGSGDYITAADSPSLELGSNDFTIELWLEPFSQIQYATALIARTKNSFALGSWGLYMNLASASAGDIQFYAADIGGSGFVMGTSGVDVRDGSSHFIQLRRAGMLWAINVDGVTRATATWNGSITDSSGDPLVIGNDLNFSPRAINGNLGAVRMTIGVARPNEVPIAPFVVSN